MEKKALKTINVPLSRELLKPEDFTIDPAGNLSIDKKRISELVRENIAKTPRTVEESVSVEVSVGISVGS